MAAGDASSGADRLRKRVRSVASRSAAAPESVLERPVRGGVLEPVGLVHDQVVVFGQHLAEVGLAHDQVRHQQVMVHDEDLAGMRLLPQGRQVTLLVMRTAAADAVLGNGRDAAPVLGRSPESTDLVAVSGLRLLRPGGDPPQVGAAPGIELQVPFGLELLPLQPAEIVLAPLHAGHRHTASQKALKLGKVLLEELVLKILGRRRDHHPLPAEERRDQIGERLADPGSRLDHQRPVPVQRRFDPRRHFHLPGPVFEAGQRLGEHPVGPEEIGRPTHSRRAPARCLGPETAGGRPAPPPFTPRAIRRAGSPRQVRQPRRRSGRAPPHRPPTGAPHPSGARPRPSRSPAFPGW